MTSPILGEPFSTLNGFTGSKSMFAQVTAVGHQLYKYGVPHDGYFQHPNCLIGWTPEYVLTVAW